MGNKLIGSIMTIVVGVILVGSLLSVVISDYSTSTLIKENEGMPFAEADEDEHTIVVTSSGITADGVDMDMSLFPSGFRYYSIVMADAGFIRIDTTGNQLRVPIPGAGIATYNYSTETVTVTITGDTAVVTTTASETTSTLTDVNVFICPDGDYVMTLKPYLNAESKLYGAGHTGFTTPSATVYVVWTGTMSDLNGTGVGLVPSSSFASYSVDDVTMTADDLGNGLYRTDEVRVNYSLTDTSANEYSVYSSYTYFVAPAEVEYDNPDYLGAQYVGLLGAIVTIAIAGLLIVAVGSFRNRD